MAEIMQVLFYRRQENGGAKEFEMTSGLSLRKK